MIVVKATLKESEERMGVATVFREERLSRVRAGRANVASRSSGAHTRQLFLKEHCGHLHAFFTFF